jgi:polyhydroxyalkanoic acid synthase PhaR subunit
MSERSQQPDQKELFALWRKLYDANEQVWSKASGEFMETPAFAQWQGKMLETFLGFQSAWKESATAQLEAANIATRDDVVRLGELIVGLEEKVDQLADRLDDRVGTARAPKPQAGTADPKTRKPVKKAKSPKRPGR